MIKENINIEALTLVLREIADTWGYDMGGGDPKFKKDISDFAMLQLAKNMQTDEPETLKEIRDRVWDFRVEELARLIRRAGQQKPRP